MNSFAQNCIEELALLECKQLVNYNKRFDLSGISFLGNDIYVIADKKENNFLYKIDWNENNWTISPKIKFDLNTYLDLEGLVIDDDIAYLANEADNEVYKINIKTSKVEKLKIKWDNLELNKDKWIKNAGFEGIALDKNGNRLFLAKERDPRLIIEIDLNTLEIIEQYDLRESCSNDFADIFYYDGYLYGLERNALCLAKIDVESKKIIKHYSYKDSASKKGQKLFEPAKYGMAEALMIYNGKIWIGWDNNAIGVSKFGEDTYHLTGTLPLIMTFSLPDDI